MSPLFSPLTLPNGQILKNRICKAAMEENMAETGQVPGVALSTLYKSWAEGGAGLLLTGNVMVDPTAMTGPGGVVLEQGLFIDAEVEGRFQNWARAAKAKGAKAYMQISHPGRQVYASQGTVPVSASSTKVTLPGPANNMFVPSRALTGDEILGLIKRFADTAALAERAGFDGVQVHAAHGYLVAQFLSPLTNLREDIWGGSLENRSRFLRDIVGAIRERVEPGFGVAVKLNSADFQKGGYDIADAKQVVEWLNLLDVDFIEVSGGSYESAAMMGMADDPRAQSTREREMYFIEFAKDIQSVATMPIMVTGGVTKRAVAESAIEAGVDLVGIARGFAFSPALASHWKSGHDLEISLNSASWKNKALASLANMALTKEQLTRLSRGQAVKVKQNAFLATVKQQLKSMIQTRRYKAWLKRRGLWIEP